MPSEIDPVGRREDEPAFRTAKDRSRLGLVRGHLWELLDVEEVRRLPAPGADQVVTVPDGSERLPTMATGAGGHIWGSVKRTCGTRTTLAQAQQTRTP